MSHYKKRKEANIIPSPSLVVTGSAALDATQSTVLVNGPPVNDGFTVDLKSVSIGDRERMVAPAGLLNIANAWTVSFWLKPEVFAAAAVKDLFMTGVAGANSIAFTLELDNKYRIKLRSTVGSVFKDFKWANSNVLGVWINLTATWDGLDLLLYENGSAVTPAITTDNAASMIDTSRDVRLGASLVSSDDIDYYSMAAWNATLSASEVQSIYNSGNASDINLAVNFGGYSSSSNLEHWWRMGLAVAPNIGLDTGIATLGARTLVTTGSQAVDDTDIVSEFPGVNATLVTVTLPDVATNDGREYTVKDNSGNSDTGAITVDATGSDTINGFTQDTIQDSFLSRTYTSDGISNWITVADAGSSVTSSSAVSISTVSTTSALGANDGPFIDVTAGSLTITLPPVALVVAGKTYTIKDSDGVAAATNITIDGNAAETIDGVATFVMDTDFQSVSLISLGDKWVVSQNTSPDELTNLNVVGTLDVDNDLVNTMGVTTVGTTGAITTEDLVNATTGGITITLPPAATAGTGKVIHIKDRDGSATANNITIEGDSAETIDGSLTFVLTVNYQSVTLVSDGSNWMII
jgi:hypothetical protein